MGAAVVPQVKRKSKVVSVQHVTFVLAHVAAVSEVREDADVDVGQRRYVFDVYLSGGGVIPVLSQPLTPGGEDDDKLFAAALDSRNRIVDNLP